MLIAPAGYGKTTLAEQWTSAGGRQAVWYPCRRSSADVALLAVGLAEAAAPLLPGCDRRVRERLRVMKDPTQEVEVLAELLAADLAGWPANAWLVLDDYHHLKAAREAERLVEAVISNAPIQLVITSRIRPSWSTRRLGRRGEVFAIGAQTLAMDVGEADEVLQFNPSIEAEQLVEVVKGWPAVIALASNSNGPGRLASAPHAMKDLYDVYADEIYARLAPGLQEDLCQLALAPRLDRELLFELLGKERGERVLSEAAEIGVFDSHGGLCDFHPLARSFLAPRTRELMRSGDRAAFDTCLRVYRSRLDWDSAFDLVETWGSTADVDELVADALDPLLEMGRLATLEAWVERVQGRGELSSQMLLVASELAVRRNELSKADALVQCVLSQLDSGSPLQFRALHLAGLIAHLASREAEAVKLYERAEQAATTKAGRREARWGQYIALAALEDDRSRALLDELAAESPRDDVRERVRLAGKQLFAPIRFGYPPDLTIGRRAEELLPLVADPMIRSSFRNCYALALMLGAHYADALRVARELIAEAAEANTFGLTYGYTTSALALAGMRRFSEAHEALDAARRAAEKGSDAFGIHNAYAARIRVLLQQDRAPEACMVEPPDTSPSLPSIRAEALAARGLALACVGRSADGLALAAEATSMSKALEPSLLARAVKAVIDVRARGEDALDSASALLDEALGRGGVDLFVTAYRASPAILSILLANPGTSDSTVFAVQRAGDQGFATAIGASLEAAYDVRATLSPREQDVFALVCEGLSDREISKRLYIAPGTTKTHIHRILEKTGYSTRRALILDTARRRNQATSTMAEDSDDTAPES